MQWWKAAEQWVEEGIEEADFAGCSETPAQRMGLLPYKPCPRFHILPLELKLLIFSFLPPEEVASVLPQVCREWRRLADDERSWLWRYKRDRGVWKVYSHEPQLLLSWHAPLGHGHVAGSARVANWRERYLQQHLANGKCFLSPERALTKMTSNERQSATQRLSYFISRRSRRAHHRSRETVFCIPIFGQGLNSSASELLYSLMWAQESPLFVTGLYPGIEGVGSGVGFTVNRKRLNLAAFYREEPLMKGRRFFETAHGLIYVLDARISDVSLMQAREELSEARTCNPHAPLLILNCTPLPSRHEGKAEEPVEMDSDSPELLPQLRHPYELGSLLKLEGDAAPHEWKRPWRILSVSTVTDVCRGLDWLSATL